MSQCFDKKEKEQFRLTECYGSRKDFAYFLKRPIKLLKYDSVVEKRIKIVKQKFSSFFF